ncbi:cation diffusion facilitator family transporter [Agaribacter flavus]|uniref:Cation diffusion facilitator family transporter n=1 Tax=Agaribacter flavus TaxID=1902781 RepID=A0ABV7FMI0_9ALTE
MIQDRRIKTSLVAICADLVLTAIKAFLAVLTGSAALLADAYHSATDFIVSLILLCGLVIRHGQEKSNNAKGIERARRLESVLAIFVAVIILYVPVEIVQTINANTKESLDNIWFGILGMLVVIALVFFMAKLKTHVGKETDSPALEADGYHSLVDLFSSIAVLISLIGFMIGIDLDDIVAILIAVMIGFSGLELLASGVRSLVKGSDFDHLSLMDSLGEVLKKLPIGKRFHTLSEKALRMAYAKKGYAIIVCIAAYVFSGFQQVPYGQVGVKQLFHKNVSAPLPPGLYYRFPWPMGAMLLMDNQVVLSVTVDNIGLDTQGGEHKLWQEIKENRVLSDNTPYLVTGDENLLALAFTLQYRLSNPFDTQTLSDDLSVVVKQITESALADVTGGKRFNDILKNSHQQFSDEVALRVKHYLSEFGIDISIVDAQMQSIQPPAMVVSSYRDVLTAHQEKQQRINRAEAQGLNDLPVANAEVIRQSAANIAQASENLTTAEGDIVRLNLVADVYEKHKQAFKYNHYINSVSTHLENKRIVITDKDIAHEDIRQWVNNKVQVRK